MKSPIMRPIGKLPPWSLAGFDSASSFVRALSGFPQGKEFAGLGGLIPPSNALGAALNALPPAARDKLYASPVQWRRSQPAS